MRAILQGCILCLPSPELGRCRRSPCEAPAATLWTGNAIVHALSFDDPYLAAALGDGSLVLVNVDAAMRGGRGSSPRGGGSGSGVAPPARQFPGTGRPAYCVELRDQWMASGGGAVPFSNHVPEQRVRLARVSVSDSWGVEVQRCLSESQSVGACATCLRRLRARRERAGALL